MTPAGRAAQRAVLIAQGHAQRISPELSGPSVPAPGLTHFDLRQQPKPFTPGARAEHNALELAKSQALPPELRTAKAPGGFGGNPFAASPRADGGKAVRRALMLAKDDAGKTLPESPRTLHLQRQALLAGKRKAMLFPKGGGREAVVAPGMERMETPDGVIHYNPGMVSEREIARAIKHKRLNEVLGLGPYSKTDIAKRVSRGVPPVSVVARDARGVEAAAALGTHETAPEQMPHIAAQMPPGGSVGLENPAETVLRRADGGAAPVLIKLGSRDPQPKEHEFFLPPGHPEREKNLLGFMRGSVTPPVLYHSTPRNFSKFRTDSESGAHFGTKEQANAFGSQEHPSEMAAWTGDGGAGRSIMPSHVAIKNPLRLTDAGDFHPGIVRSQLMDLAKLSGSVTPTKRLIEMEFPDDHSEEELHDEVRKTIIGSGYDGIVYLNRREGIKNPNDDDDHPDVMDDKAFREQHPEAEDSYIAFRPQQIKSAVGNTGMFNPNDPDITKADGGEVGEPIEQDTPAATIEMQHKAEPLEYSEAGFGLHQFVNNNIGFAGGARTGQFGTDGTHRLGYSVYDLTHPSGKAELNFHPETKRIEGIVNLEFDKKYRGMGYGTRAVKALAASNPEGLQVYDIKKSAKPFWAKMGGDFRKGDPKKNELAAATNAFIPHEIHKANGGEVDDYLPPDHPDRQAKLARHMEGNHPLVPHTLYHGTARDIKHVDMDAPRRIDGNVAPGETDTGWFGKGFYLTPNRGSASGFARNDEGSSVYPMHVSMKNPFIVRGTGGRDMDRALNAAEAPPPPTGRGYRRPSEQTAWLKSKGHDGVIALDPDGYHEFVAFDPLQIKSAVGNNGHFDPHDADIRKAGGGEVDDYNTMLSNPDTEGQAYAAGGAVGDTQDEQQNVNPEGKKMSRAKGKTPLDPNSPEAIKKALSAARIAATQSVIASNRGKDEPPGIEDTANPKRLKFTATGTEGKGPATGIVIPRHVWEGGVNAQGGHIPGMEIINRARAQVYGSEHRKPLNSSQASAIHKAVLAEHFRKPLAQQMADEASALNKLRAAKHLSAGATTLDESEKLDTVRHEHDDQGRSHIGYAAKGVAGHALYTSGVGSDSKFHIINTCAGQNIGCGGGKDANGVVDTSHGTCFAPHAEAQYSGASIKRACHEQAKHDPAMTKDWILAHTGALRSVSNKADKSNQVTLFRPNVVDETDSSSRHVIRGLNEQREAKGLPRIIANSYGKTTETHDPENGYFVTYSNSGPKVKKAPWPSNGVSEVKENIARDKQRVRSTIMATNAGGSHFMNDEGHLTPPKNSYMVTDVARGSQMDKDMQGAFTHAKYWSAGRKQSEISANERAEGPEDHFGANGEPTTPEAAHYGHVTVEGNRYDYQKQHILHPRLVAVKDKDKDTTHLIPTDSRFKDNDFLPKNRFMSKNGKQAGAILLTTPTTSTSDIEHKSSFTHHIGPEDIAHAKNHNGEYEIDSPHDQEAARGNNYQPPRAPGASERFAAGGAVWQGDDGDREFPEQSFIAQRHNSHSGGMGDPEVPHHQHAGGKGTVLHFATGGSVGRALQIAAKARKKAGPRFT